MLHCYLLQQIKLMVDGEASVGGAKRSGRTCVRGNAFVDWRTGWIPSEDRGEIPLHTRAIRRLRSPPIGRSPDIGRQ